MFACALADEMQNTQGLQKSKHAADSVIILFAKCLHPLCYFFLIIKHSVLIPVITDLSVELLLIKNSVNL